MNAMPANRETTEALDIELPPMWSSTMDHAELLAWAKDVKSLCQLEEVRVKGGAELHSHDAAHGFSEAVSELICHHLAALQVRYVYDGHTYFDTALSEPGCFRLVRLMVSDVPKG
jgi:hypothetical protein